MRNIKFWGVYLPMMLFFIHISVQAKKQKTSLLTDITEYKDFKRLLRSKTNVMILFVNAPKSSNTILEVFRETADAMKGQATLVVINCHNGETKKLCKKLKIPNSNPYYIKHYKNGEFHKDYDRSETINSFSNFLRDPTGDLPWEEDPSALDIFHLTDGEALIKFLKKGAAAYKKSMVMFYAPWCGYCKTLKPEYISAAAELKGEALLAAIDLAKPGNSKIRQSYNITGFPTLLYYEKGQLRFPYNGENKKESIVAFMRDPTSHLQQKKKEVVDESWSSDSDVVHLTAETFDDVLTKAEHALVVFYAPWCGHCKKIKPEFERAATRIKSENVNGILAAVDATKEPELATRFAVKGYPTLKYFNKGEYKFDAGSARQEEQIVKFVKEPTEPLPPPPAEKPWSEEESHVRHLHNKDFRTALRKVKHALVMFYAPWCGHCKSTKPEFVKAADKFADELMVAFAAVDCTSEQELCANYAIQGYPTFKYFSYFDKLIKDYSGGRKEKDLVSFIHSQMDGHQTSQKAAKTNQDAGFGVNVVLSSDEDFENYINSATPTFVMFYASWCGHCVTAKPAFSRLATTVKTEKLPFQIIAVDAAENPKVADIAGIETLPTFKIFSNGKILADYTGDRSTEDMLSFCNSHSKVKDEL